MTREDIKKLKEIDYESVNKILDDGRAEVAVIIH